MLSNDSKILPATRRMGEKHMEKEVCIFMGSPRKNGNTAQALGPFLEELEKAGCRCSVTWLYDKNIRPCRACRTCQKDWTKFGCALRDDMQELFDQVRSCDLLVLATPIYSWYCTPPMKAALDRLVYGMNKYYGEEKGPALWAGKKVALLTTCGYPVEKGADLWEAGMRRYCKHSRLAFAGSLALHDPGYHATFMTPEKEAAAREFARGLLAEMDG